MEDRHSAYRNQHKDGTFEVKCNVLGTAENGWLTPADDSLLPKGVTWSSVMQCYVCARDSRLNDPEGNQRHDETRQYAITDDMAGKIRLLARETLTHAIAAQLSGEDLQGQFRSKLDDLVEGDRQALRIICDFMPSCCKSISPVVHPLRPKSTRAPRRGTAPAAMSRQ